MTKPLGTGVVIDLARLMGKVETLLIKHCENVGKGWGFSNVRENVCTRYGTLYVRAGLTFIDEKYQPALELASIYVPLRHRNRGICEKILLGMEALSDEHERVFVVENVLNPKLDARLVRRPGYKLIRASVDFGGSPTYYRNWVQNEGDTQGESPPDTPGEGRPKATT